MSVDAWEEVINLGLIRMRLTPLEQLVLLAASQVEWLPNNGTVATGVYRALVLRRLLERRGGVYRLTPDGKFAVEMLRHMDVQGFRQ